MDLSWNKVQPDVMLLSVGKWPFPILVNLKARNCSGIGDAQQVYVHRGGYLCEAAASVPAELLVNVKFLPLIFLL